MEYTYLLSEQLGFINSGLTIKLWGPSTEDIVLTKLKDDGHQLGPRPYYTTDILEYVAYCNLCMTSVSKVLDEYFIGSMLDIKCGKIKE